MTYYNIRMSHGKRKGKFVKAAKKEKLEKIRAAQCAKKLEKINIDETRNTEGRSACEIFGNRIVNIRCLAENMWCTACNIPLSFRDIKNEHKYGTASLFEISCKQCRSSYLIPTDFKTKDLYNMNYRVALGNVILAR